MTIIFFLSLFSYIQEYSNSPEDLKNTFIHLTNYSVNKNNEEFVHNTHPGKKNTEDFKKRTKSCPSEHKLWLKQDECRLCIGQTLFFHNVQRHLFLQSINNINRRKIIFLIKKVIICDLECHT